MGSLRPTQGATQVAGVLSGGARGARVALVDGIAALVWAPGGDIRGIVSFTVDDGKIVEINVTGDPDRIQHLDVVLVSD
jgi:RNA polymerase sigma-70 factor (ECF subfamily)